MTNHERLIEQINSRWDLLDGDLRSFIYLRSDGKGLLNNTGLGLGGGNLLVMMGELSYLSFLAKISRLLDKGAKGFSTVRKQRSNKLVNETIAFRELVRKTDYPFGIPNDEHSYNRVWNSRNLLMHMTTLPENQASQTYVFDDSISFTDATELTGVFKPPFEFIADGRIICNIDRLRRSIGLVRSDVNQWVREASNDKVKLVLSWINRVEKDQLIPTINTKNQ